MVLAHHHLKIISSRPPKFGEIMYHLSKQILLILLLPFAATAQDEIIVSPTGCAEILAAPPFVDILTRNEGNDFQELSPLKSGRALLGLECTVEELTEFFENAEWEFLEFEEGNLAGPLGGHGGIPEYFRDAGASYCKKRPTILGFFPRCRPRVRILFHEGQISHLIVHMSK